MKIATAFVDSAACFFSMEPVADAVSCSTIAKRPSCKYLYSWLNAGIELGSKVPDTGALCGVAPTAAAAVPGLLAFVYGLLEV